MPSSNSSRKRPYVGVLTLMRGSLPSFEHGPRDHLEGEDLLRPLEDREDARVDEVARDRILLRVAHAAVDLLRLAGHPLGDLAREELDERRLRLRLGPARVERRRDLVRERARALDERRHARDLPARELVVADRRAEDLALARVADGRLERGLHDAHRARRRLEPPAREALHLEVEALPEAALAADHVLDRDVVALEAHLVAVHAAVADRADRAARDLPVARGLGVLERVPLEGRLLGDQDREAL